MFPLSAKFRKSLSHGAADSVYYTIRKGKAYRYITEALSLRDDKNILSDATKQIASDLMAVYCMIEDLQKRNPEISLEEIVGKVSEAVLDYQTHEKHIDHYDGNYLVCDDVAKISKLFSDFFVRERKAPISLDKSTLLGFLSSLVQEYSAEGKPYSKSLRSTLRSLERYLGGKDIMLKDFTGKDVDGYKRYLDNEVSPETTAFYIRNLRTALIRAEREQLLPIDFRWPEKIKTNIPRPDRKSKNDGLDLKSIRMIEQSDLSFDKTLDFARDMFMFGFYAKGMELIDLAMLKRENLNGSTLIYNRRGKGKERKVELGHKAMAIVDKYNREDCEFLFPIIQRKWMYSYSTARRELADSLKIIGMKLQLPINLTFSMNIYSWKSVIKNANIAEALIS